MPGRSAANRMRQCANAKTVTTSFVRVYPLVALQCGPAPNRYRCVTRRQLTRYAMPWRQQASRPIQCTSCTGSMPLRGVLRPRRLPERNRHAGDFWRPNACLMTVLGQGEPESSRKRPAKGKRRAKGVSAIVLARDRSLGANVTCVHCKPRSHGRTTRQRMSLRAATHSGSAFTHQCRTAR